MLVGIHTRGVILSQRLGENIQRFEGNRAPLAELDINLYRDDLQARESPRVRPTKFPVDVQGKNGWCWWTTYSLRAAPSAPRWMP